MLPMHRDAVCAERSAPVSGAAGSSAGECFWSGNVAAAEDGSAPETDTSPAVHSVTALSDSAGSTCALAELLTAQRVFQCQLVLVNALLDEQQILRIRRVEHGAGKQIAQVILPMLAVKPGDLVNRFNPRRAEFVGPQIRIKNERPGESQPLVQSSNLVKRIPDLLIPATH